MIPPIGMSHQISPHELTQRLGATLARGRYVQSMALRYLAVADERRVHVDRCLPSLLRMCTEEFGLDVDEAARLIQAARVGMRFPEVFERIADGSLPLAAVRSLAPFLTRENCADVLASVSGLTSVEIERRAFAMGRQRGGGDGGRGVAERSKEPVESLRLMRGDAPSPR